LNIALQHLQHLPCSHCFGWLLKPPTDQPSKLGKCQPGKTPTVFEPNFHAGDCRVVTL
jgi:hypothetical protein